MNKIIFILYLISSTTIIAQEAYYNDVNLTLTGIPLKNALATKIISTHTNNLSYNEAREALKIIDLEPGQNTNVLLLYGFSNGICPANSGSDNDHRLRNKNNFGGGQTCEWNREHTYPKGLGTPNLGTSGPGADAHHLRACDVGRNGQRSSKKFATGSGNSGIVGSNWYPGDEWKGDVARMMMYMYLRYGNRCLPTNVTSGTTVANDNNMVALLLQWNADDPVSNYEKNRNNYLELTSNQYGQGNRNPFIDNPYLATRIWGGQDAEDLWGIYLSTNDYVLEKSIRIYPNPVQEELFIKTTNLDFEAVTIYSIVGEKVQYATKNKVNVKHLPSGIYFASIKTNKGVLTKKIILN